MFIVTSRDVSFTANSKKNEDTNESDGLHIDCGMVHKECLLTKKVTSFIVYSQGQHHVLLTNQMSW